MDTIQIKIAKTGDAAELLAIYAPYVQNTAITFEYEVPSLANFTDRVCRTLQKYPYLTAVKNGEILGYAYAGVFHERAAYDWAVETSIYVKQRQQRMGIGRLLHEALEQALQEQHILNMNACIACPQQEDDYLTRNSILFHTHMGYRMVGEFMQCGYKFHRWYNMVWMEKHIGEHLSDSPTVLPFPEVKEILQRKFSVQ